MTMTQELITNRVLTALPAEEFARLAPLLEPVSLSAGEVVNASRFLGAKHVRPYIAQRERGQRGERNSLHGVGVRGLSTHARDKTLDTNRRFTERRD